MMLSDKCFLHAALQDLSVVVLASVVFLLSGAEAVSVLDAYRLVQMDVDGSAVGSRSVRLNQYATLYSEEAQLFRSIIIIPFAQVTEQILRDIVESDSGIAGLVLILPRDMETKLPDEDDIKRFREVESFLLSVHIPCPVYFVKDSDDIDKMVQDIKAAIKEGKHPTASTGGYLMVVKGKGVDPKPFKNPQLTNMQGWLAGSEGRPGRTIAPTIAITAHYDTFAAAPGLAVGDSSNGSGALILLSLVRMFGTLYAAPESLPHPNILFLLTDAGELDYMGLRHWVKTADNRLLDSLEFVICLDSLSDWTTLDSNRLYLHYSKPPKDPGAKEWYDRIEQAASKEGIPLIQVHKKVNLSSPYAAWGHEYLAQHKLLAVTLSGVPSSQQLFRGSSILDRSASLNHTFLAQTARIVGEAISTHLYREQKQDLHLFKAGSSLDASMPFIHQWARVLGSTPRMVPYSVRSDILRTNMMGLLKEHTSKATSQKFVLEGRFKFYGSETMSLTIFKSAGAVLDLVLSGMVVSYLLALFVALRVGTMGWDSLFAIFRAPPKKGKRGVSSGR